MVELNDLRVGFPDVEQFCLELETKYRATATGDLREKGEKSPEWQVVKACMKLKMLDESKVNKELLGQKYKYRKDIEEEYGKNSRRSRNPMKKLHKEAAKKKKEMMKKYEEKLKHLRRKYRESEEDEQSTRCTWRPGTGETDSVQQTKV